MADGSGIGASGVAMFGSLMFVAVVAVILSQRANTAAVLQALGQSTGGIIGAAVSPVTAGNSGSQASPVGAR